MIGGGYYTYHGQSDMLQYGRSYVVTFDEGIDAASKEEVIVAKIHDGAHTVTKRYRDAKHFMSEWDHGYL